MGGHRAGVAPQTTACSILISSLLDLEEAGTLHLLGLYSHAGQSYSSSAASDALDFLRQEFEALLVTAIELKAASPSHPLVLCKSSSILNSLQTPLERLPNTTYQLEKTSNDLIFFK